jgi:phenylacetate-CoA ligase
MTELDALRQQRLRRTLAAVAAAHPYYRVKFKALGIAPGDIGSLDDLVRLPPTPKQDYIADPEVFRLLPDDLPADCTNEERVLWDVAYTTGTTSGKPSPFYNTAHDAYAIWDQARRSNLTEGLVATDRVANLYPLAGFPTGAFLSVIRSTMILGLPVVHGLTGAAHSDFKVRNSLAEALDVVERFRPSVLWGVPSFVRRFLNAAMEKGANFAEVRLVLTSGEPVPQTLRAEIKDALTKMGARSPQIRARYAFTEIQGGLVQCAEHAEGQNVAPDLYFLETVDDTGRRLPDGEAGQLAITHLHRRGTVMLRYLVGDVVTLSRAPCPHCGRLGERVIATPRRTGNLVKCRGMLVNTELIADTVSALPGVSEFQIVFRRAAGAMDEMLVRIEHGEDGTLREAVIARVREAVSLRPEIEFVARGALYDHEQSIKTKRVVDLREASD